MPAGVSWSSTSAAFELTEPRTVKLPRVTPSPKKCSQSSTLRTCLRAFEGSWLSTSVFITCFSQPGFMASPPLSVTLSPPPTLAAAAAVHTVPLSSAVSSSVWSISYTPPASSTRFVSSALAARSASRAFVRVASGLSALAPSFSSSPHGVRGGKLHGGATYTVVALAPDSSRAASSGRMFRAHSAGAAGGRSAAGVGAGVGAGTGAGTGAGAGAGAAGAAGAAAAAAAAAGAAAAAAAAGLQQRE